MFTGIIEERGEVTAWEQNGDAARLTVRAPIAASDAHHGDSIAVSGVCLTVIAQGPDWFTADVMAESIAASTVGRLTAGDSVNIERAAAVDSRLGGHIVQGHVDGVTTILSTEEGSAWRVVRLALPRGTRTSGHPQGLDRRRRHLAHGQLCQRPRRIRAVVRGLADPGDPGCHDSRHQEGGRLREPRDGHPGPPRPAPPGFPSLRHASRPRRRGRSCPARDRRRWW